MAEQTELEVAPRTVVGKANKRLRKEGLIPGNIFGHNEAAQPIQLDAVRFDYLRRHGALRNILTLRLSNADTQTVLLRHVQREPKTGKILHVDFSRVSLTERVTMRASIRFVGESPAVKNEGGVLLHLVEALEVECSASDIVDALEVDISSLAEIDAALHASDVKLPPNFTLITNPEEPIAKVAATRAEVAGETTETAAVTPPAPAPTASEA
ncbi:MAG: 50S ribosomal protein L25 [Ktedonobacteraceae bacterium]|nr:50S ribosomal protein L25 [Ktedonobacteraceae bacterium]